MRLGRDAFQSVQWRFAAAIAPWIFTGLFTWDYLRSTRAGWPVYVGVYALLLAVSFPIMLFEVYAIWSAVAQKYFGSGQGLHPTWGRSTRRDPFQGASYGQVLHVKSVRYRGFHASLFVEAEGKDFEVTLYGPRRRVEKALALSSWSHARPDCGSTE
jgi:hypothetical protein